MNVDHYWIGNPHNKISGAFKFYYLVQFGFWLQQFYVVNTDMKRKDYIAMVAHHIITCTLIGWSYSCHLTRIGNAILVVMDVSDVFLAVSPGGCFTAVPCNFDGVGVDQSSQLLTLPAHSSRDGVFSLPGSF